MRSVKEVVENDNEEKDQNHERLEIGQIGCALSPLDCQIGIEEKKNTYP
jgi:hypothetical protein